MAKEIDVKELLDAGVHFGHLTHRWDPNMAPYIYMERNGIHIINLYKSAAKLDEAARAMQKIAASGRKILFVSTKTQAKEILGEGAENCKMPYITERWPGGMLTNFVTIRRSVKKMDSIDRMKKDGRFDTLSKREQLQINRTRNKLETQLGSIKEMSRLPGALFVVDILREHIAVKEAQRLNIPIFAMVDTNSDPRQVEYPVPSNDDASKSIRKVVSYLSDAVSEGLENREKDLEIKRKEKAEAKARQKEAKAKKEREKTAKTEQAESEKTKAGSAKPKKAKAEKPETAKAGEKAGAAKTKSPAKEKSSDAAPATSEKKQSKPDKKEGSPKDEPKAASPAKETSSKSDKPEAENKGGTEPKPEGSAKKENSGRAASDADETKANADKE